MLIVFTSHYNIISKEPIASIFETLEDLFYSAAHCTKMQVHKFAIN